MKIFKDVFLEDIYPKEYFKNIHCITEYFFVINKYSNYDFGIKYKIKNYETQPIHILMESFTSQIKDYFGGYNELFGNLIKQAVLNCPQENTVYEIQINPLVNMENELNIGDKIATIIYESQGA